MKRAFLIVATLMVASSAMAADPGRVNFILGVGMIVGYSEACGYAVDEDKLLAAMDARFPAQPEDLGQLSAYISTSKSKAKRLDGLTKKTECHAAAQAAASLGALRQ